ncbi:alpha/beta hydrolase fold domain-containing protein [Streptoalloteichus hindustanus]|uniref:Acetyl esterase/lipase n=1 Tax=Streptoalloteichus hindustanus TaxID=2017 RepID=A0A1M5FJD0_STRHI|nr:alpha/beta hydrolase fold domain-containing protein [Streptoalloteichus hindustanus]SHF91596.1 Acetyl esterase/lipase [Streptoalloteichus hindustanus]
MPSSQLLADLVARTLKLVMRPRLKAELRFDEIPGRTSVLTVPTRHGTVTCTAYHPASGATAAGVYVNLHGGGYVVEHPEQDDPWCRYLADKAGVVVLNVDYSVAPRHRFPVAVEQVFDVVTWAARADRDWDGQRLCVGGQSAGGGLAAAAARLAWENGGPRIALQVLQYAPLDLVTHLRNKPSTVDKPVMRPWMSEVFDRAYAPDLATRRDRLVSPAWKANAEGLAGIAPAVIITCEFDRLRGEGIRYAEALDAVGSLAEHHDVPATDHGYNILPFGTRAQTERTYQRIADHVRRATS